MTGAHAQPFYDEDASPSRDSLLTNAEALASYLTTRLVPPMRELVTAPEPSQLMTEPRFRGKAPRQAAVLAPLYAREGKPYLLFTQRATDLPSHSGEISFPGGSRDPADASLAQTALRESFEEVGLEQGRVTLLGSLPAAYTVVSNFLVTPYVGWLGEGLPTLRPQVTEVAEVIEAPLSELDDQAIYHEEIWSRGGLAHTVHFYDLGPYRIWGLTGRLLHQFLALLPTRG